MSKLRYIIFILIFLLFANWLQLRIFAQHTLTGNAEKELHLSTEKVQNILEKKANISASIKIYDSPNIYGMMVGIPGHPLMVISSTAYSYLNNDELQWLVLHETGHYVLWHTEKEFVLQIFLVFLGVLLLWKVKGNLGIVMAIVFAVCLAVIEIQLAKNFENEASRYALIKMDHPIGMVSALKKLENQAKTSGVPENLFTQLTYRWEYSLFHSQIRDAELYKK